MKGLRVEICDYDHYWALEIDNLVTVSRREEFERAFLDGSPVRVRFGKWLWQMIVMAHHKEDTELCFDLVSVTAPRYDKDGEATLEILHEHRRLIDMAPMTSAEIKYQIDAFDKNVGETRRAAWTTDVPENRLYVRLERVAFNPVPADGLCPCPACVLNRQLHNMPTKGRRPQ